jgi:hypothetical protein
MTTLNIPSAIPNQQRGPKLWEQALAQVLTTAAGEGTKAGIGNVMSRDYAPQIGEKKATGWERLLHGPHTSEADYRQHQAEAGDTARQERGIQATTNEAIANRGFQGSELDRQIAAHAAQQEASREQARILAGQEIQAASERQALADVAAAGRETRGAMRDVSLQADQIAANKGLTSAHAAQLQSQADQNRALMKIVQDSINQGATPEQAQATGAAAAKQEVPSNLDTAFKAVKSFFTDSPQSSPTAAVAPSPTSSTAAPAVTPATAPADVGLSPEGRSTYDVVRDSTLGGLGAGGNALQSTYRRLSDPSLYMPEGATRSLRKVFSDLTTSKKPKTKPKDNE